MIQPFAVGAVQCVQLLASVPDGTLIVNTSTDPSATIWISNNQGLQSGQGLELTYQATTTKSGTGPLYAIADSGIKPGVTASLLLTDELGSYDNVAALAAALVIEFLENPIPISYLSTILFEGNIGEGDSQLIDVHDYASAIIYAGGTPPQGSYVFVIDEAGTLLIDTDIIGTEQTRLAVQGPYLVVTNTTGVAQEFRVLGSSRPALCRLDTRVVSADGANWGLVNQAFAASQKILLANTSGDQLQGQVFAVFTVDAACKGHFVIDSLTQVNVVICDTVTDMKASAAGTLHASLMIALPSTVYTVSFQTFASAGNWSPSVHFIPAEL